MLQVLAFLLLAAPCWGAWTSIGSLLTANSKVSEATKVFNFSATCEVGNVCVCVVAADNDGDGVANDINLLTDAAGNTWLEAVEHEYDPGSARAGASASVQYTIPSTEISISTDITVNLATARTAKGISCWEYTITPGNVVSVVCTFVTGTGGVAGTDFCDASSGNQEHLAIMGVALEHSDNTCTGQVDSTCFTIFDSSTNGGGLATNMGAKGAFKIQTSAMPGAGMSYTETSSDFSVAFVALDEGP